MSGDAPAGTSPRWFERTRLVIALAVAASAIVYLLAGYVDGHVDRIGRSDWTNFSSTFAVNLLAALAQVVLAIAVFEQIKAANRAVRAADAAAQEAAEASEATLESNQLMMRQIEIADREARRSHMPHLVLPNFDKIEWDASGRQLVFRMKNIGPGPALGLGGVLFIGLTEVNDGFAFFKMVDIRYESEHSAAVLSGATESIMFRTPPELTRWLRRGNRNGLQLDLMYSDRFRFQYKTRVEVSANQPHQQLFEEAPADWMAPHGFSEDRCITVINGRVAIVGEAVKDWFEELARSSAS